MGRLHAKRRTAGPAPSRCIRLFWRAILGLCSLTFIAGGCDVWFDDDCPYVRIGEGGGRSIGYTCYTQDSGGRMPGALGGLLLFGVGAGMLALASRPLWFEKKAAAPRPPPPPPRPCPKPGWYPYPRWPGGMRFWDGQEWQDHLLPPPPPLPPPPQPPPPLPPRIAALRALGLGETAKADEIRAAYRRLVREHHPDMASPGNRAAATRKTAEINLAYEYLRDTGPR